MKNSICAIFTLLLLSGCATVGNDFNDDQVTKIVDGETTKGEIIEWFGQPNGRQSSSEYAEGYSYSYAESRATAASFIPIVGLFANGSEGHSKTLFVYFDESGTVAHHEYVNIDTSSR